MACCCTVRLLRYLRCRGRARSAGRLGRGCGGDGAAAQRRSGHRAPAARGCWAQRSRLGGGAGAGHQQPAAAQLLHAAPPRPGSTAEGGAPRRAAHRAGQRRERHTPRQTRLEPLIGARASARARRDRLNCRTPPRAFVQRPLRRGGLQGLQPCRVYGSFSFFKRYSSAEWSVLHNANCLFIETLTRCRRTG